tara:strand:- start:313 stop:627 length:315 start_codon:yes stop_codon:yes gene_type:complete
VLASSLTASLTAPNYLSMTIRQFAEQVEILVVNKHRTWSNAINADGVFLGNLGIIIVTLGHRRILSGFSKFLILVLEDPATFKTYLRRTGAYHPSGQLAQDPVF